MNIGSLVICVNNSGLGDGHYSIAIKLKKGAEYMIRSIFKGSCGDGKTRTLIRVEGIINSCAGFVEIGYDIARFREIEFPPSLEEEIKECFTRELVDK